MLRDAQVSLGHVARLTERFVHVHRLAHERTWREAWRSVLASDGCGGGGQLDTSAGAVGDGGENCVAPRELARVARPYVCHVLYVPLSVRLLRLRASRDAATLPRCAALQCQWQ